MGFVTTKEINSRKRRRRWSTLTVSVYWDGPTANRFRVLRWEPSGNVNESQNNTHMHDIVFEYTTNLMVQNKNSPWKCKMWRSGFNRRIYQRGFLMRYSLKAEPFASSLWRNVRTIRLKNWSADSAGGTHRPTHSSRWSPNPVQENVSEEVRAKALGTRLSTLSFCVYPFQSRHRDMFLAEL